MKKKKSTKSKTTNELNSIKKLIKNELYSQYDTKEEKKNQNKINSNYIQKSPEEEEKEYDNLYKQYMKEQFNPTIVNMLIIFINKSKDFPIEYQKESNFITKFITLIKKLLLNEIEISCFTILLDTMGWAYPNVYHWEYFCILGIHSKAICGKEEESTLLTNIYDRKLQNFFNNYTNIINEDKINNCVDNLTIQSINERYKQLNKFINSYCRKNFINYNGVVDKIVKLSQPYGEESNGNQLYNDEILKVKENNNNNNNINININLLNDNRDVKTNYLFFEEKNNSNKKNINNNNLVQPMFSNLFYEQSRHFQNFQYNNRESVIDYNNPNMYMPSLNLNSYRAPSQSSFKLVNNPSNPYFNNIN